MVCLRSLRKVLRCGLFVVEFRIGEVGCSPVRTILIIRQGRRCYGGRLRERITPVDARAAIYKVESFLLDHPFFVVVDRTLFPEDVVVVIAIENFRPVGDRVSGRVNEFVRDVEPAWDVESV